MAIDNVTSLSAGDAPHSSSPALITLAIEGCALRTHVRESIRAAVAITVQEERSIETELLRRLRMEMVKAPRSENPEPAPEAPRPDQSLEIAIHLSSAKAIADIIHICTGCAIDGSESRLDELGVQTLPALVYAIRRHIEEAEELQNKESWRVARALNRAEQSS